MAYPFAQAPTTSEIVSKLESRCGAKLCTAGPITGPRGPVTIRYLRREASNGILFSEPLSDEDNERMGWDHLRRVCRQLGVDPVDLDIPGLHLGWPS